MEAVRVTLHLGGHRFDRHGRAGHPPQADDLLPADLAYPAIDKGLAFLPGTTPAAALPWRRQARPPFRLGTPTARRSLGRRSVVQACIATQARHELHTRAARLGL